MNSSKKRSGRHELVTDRATSSRMAGVRRKHTSAELAVRRQLFAMGHRYRLQARDLPGSPDIVNRSRGWAIFVHGCFWHRHRGCRRTTIPKRNRAFWEKKFLDNVARDRLALQAIRRGGMQTLVVWECQTTDTMALSRRLRKFLGRAPNRYG